MLSSNLAGYHENNEPTSELSVSISVELCPVLSLFKADVLQYAPDYGVSPYLPNSPFTLSLAAVDLSRQTQNNTLLSNHEGQAIDTYPATTSSVAESPKENKPFATSEVSLWSPWCGQQPSNAQL
jgi:hypothetical protein